MMTGDIDDIAKRIYSTFPAGWLGDSNPVINSIVYGVAQGLATIYALYSYAVLQIRLATTTDDWLDLFAYDFYGTALPRLSGESDAAYRVRIKNGLFPQRVTRSAVSKAVENVVGYPPFLVENRPADTMAYSLPQFCYGANGVYGSYFNHHTGLCLVAYTGNPQDVYSAIESVRAEGTQIFVDVVNADSALFQALSDFVNVDGLPLI